MSSRLRQQVSFTPATAASTQSVYPKSAPPQKKQKMTITQTYYLAHTARGKLSSEAARGDHDLRLLVGHANLLDSLMIELQDAEREQEAWFNQTVRSTKNESNRVQWQDTIYEEAIELPDASDSESEADSESDYEEEPAVPLRRLRSPPAARPMFYNDDEDEDDYDDEDEDNDELALTRTQSHPVEREPELVADSGDSDDESPPNSPPSSLLQFTPSQGIIARDFGASKPKASTPAISSSELSLNDQDYYLQEREASQMIAVC